MTHPLLTKLPALIERLISDAARDERGALRSWLLCRGDRGFITLSPSSKPSHLVLRAAAGRSLERRLAQEEAELLYSLGLRRRTAADPFEAGLPISSDADRQALSALIAQLMERIYHGEAEGLSLRYQQAEVPELDDTSLTETMTQLSRERSHSARQRLYWAVVRSHFLLSLEGEPMPSALGPLSSVEQLMTSLKGRALTDYSALTGYSSAAVFSSWAGALRCHPEGVAVVEVKGRALLPLLLERSLGSLLINPRGQIGGELYRNELSSMEEAMRHWEQR